MGDSAECVKHIELYVSSSATLLQQEASVSAVATLLKNNMLTIEALVREMEMYLTTTDHIIRSRGILLLAEVLEKLTSKPLTDTSIHSLIGFFSERLAVRETAIQCLVAMSDLPLTRMYPLRTHVLQSTSKALDDPKRVIRQEAVRCRRAWALV